MHGYEVKWEQFVGICVGSGHLPYELSADMLSSLIEQAELRAEASRALQARLRTPISEPKIRWTFRRRYSTGNWPEDATIRSSAATNQTTYTAVADKDERAQEIDTYRVPANVTDEVALANYFRAQEADGIESHVDREVRYANWQRRRLADWKIRPLREVIEVEEEEAKAKREVLDAKKAERDEKKHAKILRAGKRAERLIAKFEKLVPADIRQNLATYTHPSLHDELRKRHIELPSTVSFLLSDMLSEVRGEKHYRYVPDPWKQVAAANEITTSEKVSQA